MSLSSRFIPQLRMPLVTLALALGAPAALAGSSDGVSILILDASGSMWGQLADGKSKIEVAREVMADFFARRDAKEPLGVIAYGHRQRGDCLDIEVVAVPGIYDAAALSGHLAKVSPRGMTPISESLRIAAHQIPATAERADIILVTDGLETCDADPCAMAAELAAQGVSIRAHVVGFGLTTEQANAMRCVAETTGGLLLTPQSGSELSDALARIEQIDTAPAAEPEAFFDIGNKAEAGHSYRIAFRGSVHPADRAGFTARGEGAPSTGPSFGVIGGAGDTGNNPFTKRAPLEPGKYDLILISSGGSVVARQPIDVVAPSNGFDAIGSVLPGQRFPVSWRGPDQVGERVVIARSDDPPQAYHDSWGHALTHKGSMRLTAPEKAGIYELRYLSANGKEVIFSRRFGVGVTYVDEDTSSSSQLAAKAELAVRADPAQDALPSVRATFRIPANFPQTALSWSAVPLDAGMSPEAWAPQTEMIVAEGEFEPGRYEVSATGPGEVEFRSIVNIAPGAKNDFEIALVPRPEDPAASHDRPRGISSQPGADSPASVTSEEARRQLGGIPVRAGALTREQLDVIFSGTSED